MYNPNHTYSLPGYYRLSPQYNIQYPYYLNNCCPYLSNNSIPCSAAGSNTTHTPIILKDYGNEPFAVNIEEATMQNTAFRTALWTGKHLQLTLMSIEPGGDIGFEIHPDLDQFIRIESGKGLVMMGDTKENLDFRANVTDDFIFIIPAGKWHNLINTGTTPIKLYSIYAPPQHPFGTVHATKEIAMAAEEHHH